jgi:hypothetical protein
MYGIVVTLGADANTTLEMLKQFLNGKELNPPGGSALISLGNIGTVEMAGLPDEWQDRFTEQLSHWADSNAFELQVVSGKRRFLRSGSQDTIDEDIAIFQLNKK